MLDYCFLSYDHWNSCVELTEEQRVWAIEKEKKREVWGREGERGRERREERGGVKPKDKSCIKRLED